MVLSMTGYGRAEGTVGEFTVSVEAKSVNGKGFDLSLRIPPALRPHEGDLRALIAGQLGRGTAEVNISLRSGGSTRPVRINTELAQHYYAGLQNLAATLGLPLGNALEMLLRMPEIVSADAETLPDGAAATVRLLMEEALAALTHHRETEGAALETDLRARLAAIGASQEAVAPLQAPRTARVKERLLQALNEAVGSDKVDANRFEQELIYYLERLDFSEEQTRLSQHCAYFLQLLGDADRTKGKRLGFVLQEIGREINTMGSKASDATIQQIVVGMKDELEKAKEQVLNVL